MTVTEYDQAMMIVNQLRREAAKLDERANALQDETERKAKLECHTRDPGFSCWCIDGLPGYYNTPREAMVAAEKRP